MKILDDTSVGGERACLVAAWAALAYAALQVLDRLWEALP